MEKLKSTFNMAFVIRLLSGMISVAGWCAVYLFFVFKYRFAFNFEIEINDHYYLVFAIPFLLLMLLLHIFCRSHAASTNKILGPLATAVVAALLAFSNYYSFGNEYFVVLSAVFLVSSALGLSNSRYAVNSILGVVLLVYLFETCTGLQQYLEAVEYGENTALAIKGSLENSGVFACYLVAHLPLISLLLPHSSKSTDRKYGQVLHYGSVLLLSAILVLCSFLIYQTQSRTAYIALLVSVAAWLLFNYSHFLKAKIKRLPKMAIMITGFMMLVLMAAGGYYLFALKKMSAMGRLMKTEITLQHFTDQFWTGTGIGRFAWYYPQWQSQYFRETRNPHPDYFLSAGESYIIFNEWLQWFKTVGLMGSILTIILLVYFFKAQSDNYPRLFNALKLTVVSILVCGFTSYPLHVNALLMLLGFCFMVVFMLKKPVTVFWATGIQKSISGKQQTLRILQNGSIVVCVLLLSMAAYKGIHSCTAARQWQHTRDGFMEPAKAVGQYTVLFGQLQTDGKFLTEYGTLLANDHIHAGRAVPVLENATNYFLSRTTVVALVRTYQQSGNNTKAIEKQQWLCNFLPNKFAPKQELLKLYQTTNDTASVKRLAHTIVTMPVKIPSSEVDQIKTEAAACLKLMPN